MTIRSAEVENAEKEAHALRLRKQGLTYEQIAAELGMHDRSGARKIVQRALDKTIQEPADELRRLEVERLDALLVAMWPAAEAGKGYAVDRCLAIMDRRAKLLGLDAPARKIVEVVTEDAVDAAIRELEGQLREMDPAEQ